LFLLLERKESMDRLVSAVPNGGHATVASVDGAADRSTLIVLTYQHAGAERLRSLLTRDPDLACTYGTGILPLCDAAAATWRSVEGRSADAALSRLAATSIRALTMPVITSVLARQGGRRWCEFAHAPPRHAATFLQLYPQTKVLCLHRSCVDVIDAAIHAEPWGLSGPAYAPFTAAYPASTVAALTAYWNGITAQLIAFEESHPEACRRVRFEDLAGDRYPDDLSAFLGIEAPRPGLADLMSPDEAMPPHRPAGRAPFPADQIPAPVLAQADNLSRKLGYPPLASDLDA
jgi:hypothetical protein